MVPDDSPVSLSQVKGARSLVVGVVLLAACSSASHKGAGTPTTAKGPIYANRAARECVEILANGGTIDSCPPNNSSATRESSLTEVSSTAPPTRSAQTKRDADGRVTGIAVLWNNEAGWGAVASPAVDGEVWVHFSNIEGTGYKSLRVGQRVTFTYETPGQDGYPHRALSVMPG
jgi:CspA family cold shock protein